MNTHAMKYTSLVWPLRVAVAFLIWIPVVLGASGQDPQESTAASAVVPQQVRYAGRFVARSGESVEAVFRIYAAAEGGEPLWSETQQVSVAADGTYSVLLGGATTNGLPQTVFAGGAARWLGVTVERGDEQERVLLSSVPYAMKSADAESLAGHQAADFVTQEQLAGLSQQMNEKVGKVEQAAATPAFQPELTPSGSGTTNTVPLWTSSSTLGNSIITQTGGKIGINFVAPTATLEVGGGMTVHGTLFFPPGVPATSAHSSSSQAFQFSASAWNSSTAAPVSSTYTFQAGPIGNNTVNPNAIFYLNYQNGASPIIGLLTVNGNGQLGLPNAAGGISSFGNVLLSPAVWATSTTPSNSPMLELAASTWSSSGDGARAQTFAWQAKPVNSDTSSPTGSLALLYGYNGATPAATGFSIAPNGQITFAPGQAFPGTTAAITGIVPASPLTGGGTSGSIALGLNESTLVTDIAPSIETAIEPGLQSGFNSVYAQLGAANTFTANQSITGTLGVSGALTSGSTSTGGLTAASESISGASSAAGYQSTGNVTVTPATPATTSAGANSPLLEIGASSWWTTSGAPRAQNFAWQALAGENDTATANGSLALLFGSGAETPVATGLAIAQNGQISFAPGQSFPGTGTGNGTITGITTTGPLSGSGTSGSVALGLDTNALETTLNSVYAQLGAENTFTGNQTITGNAAVSGSVNAGGKVLGTYSIGVEPSNTATASGGFDSFLQSYASVYNSSTAAATTPWLAWHGVPVGNNTASPGIALDFAYGPGNGSFKSTGLSIADTGQITFASGQTFPGTGTGNGTITGITTTSPLAGSGTAGSVALSLNTAALETTFNAVYPQLGSTNAFKDGASFGGAISAASSTSSIPAISGTGTNGANGVNVASDTGNAGNFSNDSLPYATIYAVNSSTSTSGAPTAITGSATGPDSVGVYGTSNGTGMWADVTGANAVSGAVALYATASNGFSGYFVNSDPSGATTFALNESTTGSSSSFPTGVLAWTFGNYAQSVAGSATGNVARAISGVASGLGGTGVYGESDAGNDTSTVNTSIGVSGVAKGADADGVAGFATGTGGYAVYAHSSGKPDSTRDISAGVYALADNGAGVVGTSTGTSDVFNSDTGQSLVGGVWGDTSAGAVTNTLAGVVGTAGNNSAGYFENDGAQNIGTIYLINDSTTSGAMLLRTTGFVGSGDDTCTIDGSGNLACSGTVSNVVPASQGARRVETYSMQSPESWMEDFGTAELKKGVAVVNIDPAFGETVSADASYHVFITPNGDSEGLYVINKTATSFEVRESKGGVSSLSFDYRIVAKRRGFEAKRLVDVTERFEAMQKERKLRMARIETMHAAKPDDGRHLFEPQMVDAAPAARTMPRPQGRPGGGHAPSERLVPGVPVSKSETHSEPVRRPEPEAHP